jgi:hypothetical protein
MAGAYQSIISPIEAGLPAGNLLAAGVIQEDVENIDADEYPNIPITLSWKS